MSATEVPTDGAAFAGVRHCVVELEGISLHVAEQGAGPAVVLLHGFPEFWYGWRHQMPALAAAGYRAVAPDLRGYNGSGKPAGVRAYVVSALAGDVARLLQALDVGPVALVGHDWGGVVAYRVAMEFPERVSRLAILNAPHPAQYRHAMRFPAQWLRAWYALFFQVPWLPEAFVRAHDFQRLRALLSAACDRPGAFTPEDVDRYVAAFAVPGALTSALNYYRAALRCRPPPDRMLFQPTLIIQGEGDRFLTRRALSPTLAWVPHQRVLRLQGAGHFVQHARPDEVNAALLAFLREA